MLDSAATRTASRARTSTSSARCAASTGSSSPPSARSSPTASGRSPGSPGTTSRVTRATTSCARRSPRGSASPASSSRSRSTPTATGAPRRGSTARRSCGMLLVYPLADDDPRLEALDRARAVPVPALGVRQAPLRARARRLPRRPGAPAERPEGRAAGGRARARPDRCSSSSSRTSAPRWSTRRRSRRVPLRRRNPLGRTLPRSVRRRARASRASSGSCPRPAIEVLEPYQTARLTGVHEPGPRPGRRDLQRQPVDHRGRLGRPRRPRRRRRDADASRLPARARDRLRLRLARRAARLRRRRAPALPLPARRLARAPRHHRLTGRLRRDRRGRDRGRASSSRCSSTSA